MQMTVQPSILDDDALLFVVKSDDFWNGGGLKLAVQGLDSTIERGEMPDAGVARFFERDGIALSPMCPSSYPMVVFRVIAQKVPEGLHQHGCATLENNPLR